MEKKPAYLLCPRCELNYFLADKNQKYCNVCLAEMNKADPSMLIPEDEDSDLEVLCPVCKINYMSPDEEMCFVCLKEHKEKLTEIDSGEWEDQTESPVEDDSIEISLSELEEEENDTEEDDEIPIEEFDNDDFFDELDDEDDDEDFDDEDDSIDDED